MNYWWLNGWRISQKLSVNGFKGIKNVFKLDEDFIKKYNENGNKGNLLEVDVEYAKNRLNLHSYLLFSDEKNEN